MSWLKNKIADADNKHSMVIQVTEEIINVVHNYVVHRLVALDGFVYSGTISGPIERIFNEQYGGQKYPSLIEKAGAILYSIVHGHSYYDGNKRTGLLTTCLFLLYNGYVLHVPDNTTVFLEKMADALDPDAPTEKDAVDWVKKNSKSNIFGSLTHATLLIYCKLQGKGFLPSFTQVLLEQNAIPYIDKEKLVDKTLRNGKKKNQRYM
jgi:death-on-curing protein